MEKNININFDLNDLDDISLDEYFEGIDFNKKIDKVNKNTKFREKKCRGCMSEEIIEDSNTGTVVCCSCGLVQGNMLDHNPEWRQYDEDGKNDNGRCGQTTNVLLPQSSLGTKFIGCARGVLQKLHTWNQMPYRERSLNTVFKIITERCDAYGIKKNIQDDSKIMYKTANDCKHLDGKNIGKYIITRGKNRKGIIAACVFFACRRNKCTRSPREIASIFSLKHTELSRGCKNLFELLRLRKFNLNLGTSKADQFVLRYCEKHSPKIKTEYAQQAVRIAKNLERLKIASEHTPFSIAATSVLVMAEVNGIRSLTKKLLAERFNVSEVTIGKVYKKIENYKFILSDDKMVDKLLVKTSCEVLPKFSQELIDRMKKFGIPIDDTRNNIEKKTTTQIIEEFKKCDITTWEKFCLLDEEFNDLIKKFN